ncbi:hypothetical protein ACFCZ1_25525 [Streptomyces sp. NPDC056224]|uniref:hypothetical protein n=1 Tax=Streptomyces sp. NPDC056224 TaxID=3345750 RepID=UPI0035E35F82
MRAGAADLAAGRGLAADGCRGHLPAVAGEVEGVTAPGSQVRTLGDGLMRMPVFDDHTGA